MEHERISIIKDVVENQKNKLSAAVKLGCTPRTIDRLIQSYKQHGEQGLIHGNTGRTPANKIDSSLIVHWYRNSYSDFNITHFCQILYKNENILVSEATVRNIFKEYDMLSPKAHKKTKKELKKKLKEQKKLSVEQKDQLIQLETEQFTGSVHPTQPRCKYFGEEIQMDASVHLWFGSEKTYLHLAIDDATGRIVGAYFGTQETLKCYYEVFSQILTTYGIPILFKTDKRTVFEYKSKKMGDISECPLTQFSHACSTLGIQLEASSEPQFKPRVERSFQTLQGRLIQEMRIAGISTLDEANRFLNSYISKFNQQFAIMEGITSCFDAQPSKQQIDQTLVTFTQRVVDCGHSIKLNKTSHRLLDAQGKQKFLRPKTKVSVITMMNEQQYVLHNDKLYAIEPIPERMKLSPAVDFEEEKKPNSRIKYIPPFDHPWRISSAKFFRNANCYY